MLPTTQYSSFCDWLISFSLISSRLMMLWHMSESVTSEGEQYPIVPLPHFSYPFIHPQSLRRFCFSIENNAIMNTGTWTSLLALIFNFISSKPRIVRWYGNCCNFCEIIKNYFPTELCVCMFWPQCTRVPTSLQHHHHHLFLLSVVVAVLKISHCHFNCTSLVIHLFTSCCYD